MDCSDFGAKPIHGKYGVHVGNCAVTVCGDGKASKGYYCGVGSCNIFGRNCDGGCIRGNPVEEFQRLHGSKVTNVVAG